MSNSDSVFDRVLHSVGDDGKFQTRCNIVFNFLLGVFSTMAYMTLILALVVPDHWCKVPGREDGNYSLEEWKLMTLPRVNNSAGQESFSSCQMFNNTQEDSGKTTVINCQYGYEYDTTWFYNTLASEQDWVCEKEIYISNVLGAGKLAEVLAGFVFGYLGDTIGRRKVYILSLCIICFGRIVSLFVVDYYYIFMAATVIASLPSTTPVQSAIVIIMELSTNEDRSYILQLYNFGWSTGLALMAFVYWITDDWFYYMLASSTPLMIYIPLSILFVESPRWLLSRGRVPECLQQLIKIAKVNGTRLSPDAALLLQNAAPKPEKVYGIGSILSNKKLAKMTILLTTCWICASVNYYLLVLVVGSLSGNPFLNFFLQAIAEIPSYVLGRFISETLGRRFSCASGFLLGMCGLITITITIHDTSLAWFHLTLFILSKFAVTTALFVVYLQSVEIYPTCVRQGGFNFVVITGGVAIIGAPYCVYLGVLYDSRIPYLISIGLCILGLITQIFLPETLHEKLPETLHEAKTFGDDQCYWSFPRKKADLYVLANLQHVDRQMSDNNDAAD